MAVVGTVEYDARINTSDLRKDAKNVERIAKDTGTSLGSDLDKGSSKAQNSLAGLGVKLVGVAASLTAVIGVSKLVSSALGDLAGLETARSGFEVLTGSVEGASKVMGDIAAYSNTTPFEFPEVAGAAKTLLGFGVAAEDVDKNIRMLGDAVAASGGEFSNVSKVFGQIFAAGKLNAEDFNQLIDNGIALGPEIAKELGIPIKDLKDNLADGKVTADVFNRALKRATDEGGKYFGATDKLALTLNGRISTLNDTFTGFIGKVVGVDFSTGIVEAGGAFAQFSDFVKAATDTIGSEGFQGGIDRTLQGVSTLIGIIQEAADKVIRFAQAAGDYLAPKLVGLWTAIQTNLIPILQDLWKNVIEPLIPVIGTLLVGAIGTVIDTVRIFTEGLGFLYQKLMEGNPIVLGLAGVFGTLAVAMAFQAVFAALNGGFAVLMGTTIPAVRLAVIGLQALIASPIVFGAIAVGAAITALALVNDAAEGAKRAINDAMDASNRDLQASRDLISAAKRGRDAGTIDEAQYRRLIGIAGRASGGPVSGNTPYFVGENKDGSLNSTSELFVPRTSGTIVNSTDLKKMLTGGSQSSGGATINQTNNINTELDMNVVNRNLVWQLGRV
jgi:tape measure domain-containing protein